MYTFTIENYNEDTNKLEYLTYEIHEGDQFYDKSMGQEVIVTVADEDHWVVCPFDSETGTDADSEYYASDNQYADVFKPVSVEVCA